MNQDLDGTKFKSEYQNDDLKRVVMVFPKDKSRSLEAHVAKEVAILSD